MLTKTKLPADVARQRLLHCRSRQLRNKPTPAEQFLWKFLRKKQLLGFGFLRQHPIDRYIVDFVCYQAKLIIEVDGPIHLKQKEQDLYRDRVLGYYGFQVLRFTNQEVFNQTKIVINSIQKVLSSLIREESQRGGIEGEI